MIDDDEDLNDHEYPYVTPPFADIVAAIKTKKRYTAMPKAKKRYTNTTGKPQIIHFDEENTMPQNHMQYSVTTALMNATETCPIDEALVALKGEVKRLRKAQKAYAAERAEAERKEAARKACFDAAKSNLERLAAGEGTAAVDAAQYLIELVRGQR